MRTSKARLRMLLAVAVCLTAAAIAAVSVDAPAQAAAAPTVYNIDLSTEFRRPREIGGKAVPNSQSAAHVPAAGVPRPASTPVSGDTPGLGLSVDGLNLRDQRTADNGNQFSLEPPDQALCVGGDRVLESVNDVMRFRGLGGETLGGVQSLNKFFIGDSAIIRGTPPVYGAFVSDPKCYYDPALGRFFFTVLSLDRDAATGDFTGRTDVRIAVSRTSTPTTDPAGWFIYRIDTTNDGSNGTPANPDCPCLGDQPLIGADAYGFYVTTNEFPLFVDGFNGAIVYAFDKAALTTGTLRMTLVANRPALAEGPGYSIQPATSPAASEWDTSNNGTAYFLSALDFDATLDNRIATWALTNTQSLTTATPRVTLRNAVLPSQVYGQPPDAEQRDGPTPLADATPNAFTGKPGNGPREHLNLLAGNDDRMQQVVLADDKLWSGLNTAVKTENGNVNVGIAWFIVDPAATATTVSGTIVNQGYVAVNRQNVMYPAIGVNTAGEGVMTFTLVGRDYYPSAAYTPIDAGGTGAISIAGAGAAPADGFSGYRFFGGSGTERWGDYSAAVADASGNVWLATEYIPGTFGFPPFLANWGTRIMRVTP